MIPAAQTKLLVPADSNIPAEEITLRVVKGKKCARTISGLKLNVVHFRLKMTLLLIAMQCYRNPVNWVLALGYLIRLRKQFLGASRLQKIVSAGGKYYMGLYTPGWNSSGYRKFIASQLNDWKPVRSGVNRFNTVFMAITKKCALQCEHCYEWDNLNKKDILSADNFSRMVQNLQRKGVGLIQFLGGEPLLKMDILTEVLLKADKKTDFWVVTSGFKLNAENARALKAAGLTGVIVSLDHFVPEKHNQFRGFRNAYYWVEEAVKNAGETGLVTALSLCATREFISEKNLMSYMQVAKNLGVSFVQFLEPRAVGHYAGQDVALREPQLRLLESFFEKMNFTKTYRDYPIISYHGYYQRRQGCFGAGVKGLYVDTDGNMNACPFCPTNNGNLLHEDLEGNLEALVAGGCPDFPKKMN